MRRSGVGAHNGEAARGKRPYPAQTSLTINLLQERVGAMWINKRIGLVVGLLFLALVIAYLSQVPVMMK